MSEVKITNSKLLQALLKSIAVNKSVFRSPHTPPLADIAESVNTCICQGFEKTIFVITINTYCHNFRFHQANLSCSEHYRIVCEKLKNVLSLRQIRIIGPVQYRSVRPLPRLSLALDLSPLLFHQYARPRHPAL